MAAVNHTLYTDEKRSRYISKDWNLKRLHPDFFYWKKMQVMRANTNLRYRKVGWNHKYIFLNTIQNLYWRKKKKKDEKNKLLLNKYEYKQSLQK